MTDAVRVLLIEDSPTDVMILEEAIGRGTQFEVTHVDRLADGIAQLAASRFDVVLLDLGLPDSQGPETLARLARAAAVVPVVVLTGLDDEELGLRLLQLGAEDYLVKGKADHDLLMRSVRYALERQRARDGERREHELEQQAHSAQEANRLKSEFLATMSHELRTPLNAIIGFTGVLLQGHPGPLNDAQREQLQIVDGSARHLLSLINDILDISRIEAGQTELHPARLDARQVAGEVAESLRPLAEGKGLALRVEGGPAPVVCDERAFRQIVLNLAGNAVKYTEAGGVTIRVAQEPREGRLVTEVSCTDTGPGISLEEQARLFHPFVQIDSTTRRRHEGTGLGLYLCRKLAELMGARVEVESTPGRGSCFRLVLEER
jgi:signal transduction histidine kinase